MYVFISIEPLPGWVEALLIITSGPKWVSKLFTFVYQKPEVTSLLNRMLPSLHEGCCWVLFYFVCMGFFGAKDTTQNLTNAKQTLCHCYCILDKKFVCVLHLCMYKYVWICVICMYVQVHVCYVHVYISVCIYICVMCMYVQVPVCYMHACTSTCVCVHGILICASAHAMSAHVEARGWCQASFSIALHFMLWHPASGASQTASPKDPPVLPPSPPCHWDDRQGVQNLLFIWILESKLRPSCLLSYHFPTKPSYSLQTLKPPALIDMQRKSAGRVGAPWCSTCLMCPNSRALYSVPKRKKESGSY